MNSASLNPREMLDLHELIRNEVTCAKKVQANLTIISDPDLKSFMQDSLERKKAKINQYHDFYDQTVPQQ